MTAFLLRRLAYLSVLVVISTSVAYLLAATQLNPRSRYEGRNPPPPPAAVDAALDAREHERQDAGRSTRFGRWAGGVVHGDLGRTIDNTAGERRDRPAHVGQPAADADRVDRGHAARRRRRRVRRGQAVPALRSRAHRLLVRRRCRFPIVVLAVLFKNAGIGLNNLLGFTGDTKLLYTTGEITPGLRSWSWAGSSNRLAHLVLPSLVLIVVADRVLRPLPAQRDARRARQRLPAHRAGQGPAPARRRSSSTACARR